MGFHMRIPIIVIVVAAVIAEINAVSTIATASSPIIIKIPMLLGVSSDSIHIIKS